MREVPFVKMQGAGNDYIYLDCYDWQPKSPALLAARLSDRHYGVGGDGLVLVLPSANADARMRMFNADGSEGKMCGNAIRCVAKYLYEEGRPCRRIETESGVKRVEVHTEGGRVTGATVDMGAADFRTATLPASLPVREAVDYQLRIADRLWRVTLVSMGNPHCVVDCEDPYALDLAKTGPQFERAACFPEGVNAEFIRVREGKIEARVWERGSGETLACGTGACAAAAACVRRGILPENQEISVRLPGGTLAVRVAESVYLTGPCETVFRGSVSEGEG